MKPSGKKAGFSILGILLLGVIAIFVLSYFKINIQSVVESPTAKDNVGYVTNGGKSIWDQYLKEPATYLWNEVVVNLLWDSFIENLQRVKNGQPTNIVEHAPALPNMQPQNQPVTEQQQTQTTQQTKTQSTTETQTSQSQAAQ